MTLKAASALTVKVMEMQTSVAPSEIWLRDDLENIYAPLFGFLGYGFRLAMRSMMQKFVILVPDPIVFAPFVFAPWSVHGKLCVTCQHTSHDVSLPGRAAKDRQERRVPAADRRPDSACVVLPHRGSTQRECGFLCFDVVLCFLLSHALSQVHRRQKQLEVESRYWRLPKSCGSQPSVWEERKKSSAKRGSLCEPRKTVAPTTDCCIFPLAEQGNVAGCSSEDGDMRDPVLSVVFFSLWTGSAW